jgi:DNA-binding NarL/FixJ family response regulator
MPVIGGIEAMKQLRAGRSPARFIFVTTEADSRVAAEAMQAGASGYLLKQSAARELLDAISTVVAGRSYLTPLIRPVTPRKLKASADSPSRELTPRQRDVLRLLAQGKKMKEIARELNISIRTVEGHKQHLMQSFGIETNADLVRFAIKQRVITG